MKNLNEYLIDEKAVSIIIGMMPASHHTTLPKPCFKKKHHRYWSRQAIFDWQATHCKVLKLGMAWAFLRGER
jgi:hypothetical protein